MADGIAGNTIHQRFRTGASGETFTIVAVETLEPDGTPWSPVIQHLEDDLYELMFTPPIAGVWTIKVVGNTSRKAFGGQFDIIAAPVATFGRVQPGQTLRSASYNAAMAEIERRSF